jgi:hypothetical protein
LKAHLQRYGIAGSYEGRVVARHRASHGFQTGNGGIKNLAAMQGQKLKFFDDLFEPLGARPLRQATLPSAYWDHRDAHPP